MAVSNAVYVVLIASCVAPLKEDALTGKAGPAEGSVPPVPLVRGATGGSPAPPPPLRNTLFGADPDGCGAGADPPFLGGDDTVESS